MKPVANYSDLDKIMEDTDHQSNYGDKRPRDEQGENFPAKKQKVDGETPEESQEADLDPNSDNEVLSDCYSVTSATLDEYPFCNFSPEWEQDWLDINSAAFEALCLENAEWLDLEIDDIYGAGGSQEVEPPAKDDDVSAIELDDFESVVAGSVDEAGPSETDDTNNFSLPEDVPEDGVNRKEKDEEDNSGTDNPQLIPVDGDASEIDDSINEEPLSDTSGYEGCSDVSL